MTQVVRGDRLIDEAREMDLTLVLACHNEEGLIRESVREIVDVLDRSRLRYEIIFVDDASRDQTRKLIDEIIVEYDWVPMDRLFHEVNKGRGGTVTDGFRLGRGRIRGYIDIDLEIHAHYILECVRALEHEAEIATAYRVYRFSWRALDRYILTKGYVWLMKKVLGTSLSDTEAGFKFYRHDRIGSLLEEIEDRGWFWDTEFLLRSEVKGLAIREVPCLFIRRYDKTSSVNMISDTLEYLVRLSKFRGTLRCLREAVGR
jgi:glycosyltransferase involved in cell wall biosynthesis